MNKKEMTLKKMVTLPKDEYAAYKLNECIVIHSIDDGRNHISISAQNRMPTYKELKFCRYQLVDNKIPMAMVFPPAELFVNVHKNCLHLWEIKDNFHEWTI